MIEKVTCHFCASRCGLLINIQDGRPAKMLRAPCENACPVGIDIPRYIRFIADHQYEEAIKIIRNNAPLPGVLGSVCHHPCETACRRGEADESVAINGLKCFAAKHDLGTLTDDENRAESTGKKVAVVGSGPAGLTAGYYLAKLGHGVTIFEVLPEAGGMMRAGIPAYRLPREILDRDIENIEAIGVEIKTGQRVAAVDDLLSQGYDAIFIGIGAHRALRLNIEGADDPRVMDCISFLKRANFGEKVDTGDTVAVVGGGYAAVDSARTALRLGAKDVTIIYRRTRREMTASDAELDEAVAEGVKIQMLTAPHRIKLSAGKIDLECVEQELGMIDDSGRPRPETIECSEFSLQFDTIITAIGQQPDITEDFGLALGRGNTIKVDPNSLTSNREGVFAGGDVVTGPAFVVDAMAAGRRAAVEIDKHLGGLGDISHVMTSSSFWIGELGTGKVVGYKNRLPIDMLSADERIKGFSRIELGFDEDRAVEEANRCLWCDLVSGDEDHPLSHGWSCKRGRADTARRYMRSHDM